MDAAQVNDGRSGFSERFRDEKNSLKIGKLPSIAWRRLSLRRNAPQPMKTNPPSRVARLSYAQAAFVQPRRHPTIGFPRSSPSDTSGDKLWTDNGARAELHHRLRGDPSFRQHWFFI